MYCIAQSITLVHCVVLLIDCDRPTGPATPQALAMTAARLLSGPCCSKLAVQRSVCARPVSITSSSSKVKPLKLRHWPISAGKHTTFKPSTSLYCGCRRNTACGACRQPRPFRPQQQQREWQARVDRQGVRPQLCREACSSFFCWYVNGVMRVHWVCLGSNKQDAEAGHRRWVMVLEVILQVHLPSVKSLQAC